MSYIVQPPKELFTPPFVLINQGGDNFSFSDCSFVFQDSLQSISGSFKEEKLLLFLTAYLHSRIAKFFLFHTAANWGTERDKVHQNELLLLPFPMPEDSPLENASEIVHQVSEKMRYERNKQEQLFNECLEQTRSLDGNDEQQAKKLWFKCRKERTEALQAELEPLILPIFRVA